MTGSIGSGWRASGASAAEFAGLGTGQGGRLSHRVILATGQNLSLGRTHAHTVMIVHVAQHILTIDLPDGAQRTFDRTNTKPSAAGKHTTRTHTPRR